jgi:hypothetical protein
VELAECSLPPAEDVLAIDGLFDADREGRRDGAVLDPPWCLGCSRLRS